MIEAGAPGVHFEDQLASEKKCGHLGGKVLVPVKTFEKTLNAARLAADVSDVPSVIVGRIDAESAKLITSDVDERDHPYIDRENRTEEGFHPILPENRLQYCIDRGIAFGHYADLLWMETSTPDLEVAPAVHRGRPQGPPGQDVRLQLLPQLQLEEEAGRRHHRQVPARNWARWGSSFQFITLAASTA